MPAVSPTRSHPRMSPVSPSSLAGRPHKPVPPGFLPSPRPKERPISEMGIRELRRRHVENMKKLEEAGPSTSQYVQRINAEQAAIESRLVELGVDDIQQMLHETNLNQDELMNVDGQQPSNPRPISAKQRALEKYSARMKESNAKAGGAFTFQEAMEIEREAYRVEQERKKEQEQRLEDKRRRMGLPQKGERALTREEQEARIYAFMNYKPTESDLEDDDDDDDDEDDPASWFEDDQDDGRKGQDIIEPDDEDYSEVIRIDTTHIPRNDLFDHEGD